MSKLLDVGKRSSRASLIVVAIVLFAIVVLGFFLLSNRNIDEITSVDIVNRSGQEGMAESLKRLLSENYSLENGYKISCFESEFEYSLLNSAIIIPDRSELEIEASIIEYDFLKGPCPVYTIPANNMLPGKNVITIVLGSDASTFPGLLLLGAGSANG